MHLKEVEYIFSFIVALSSGDTSSFVKNRRRLVTWICFARNDITVIFGYLYKIKGSAGEVFFA